MKRELIFLPGAAGSAEFWKPLGELLPREWGKTYLAWPGCGEEPASEAIRSFGDMEKFVEQRLPSGPVDLVAQSMGGYVALRLALKHGDRIRRLVLAATSGGLDVGSLGGVDWRPEYRAAYPKAERWITESRPELLKGLGGIRQPTLLLWGEADEISPVAVGRALAREIQGSVLRTVAGAGHDLAKVRAAEISGWVLRHLE